MAESNRSDSIPRTGPHPHRGLDSIETEGNEELLAKSLQSFSQKLVDVLPFRECELPDSLIDECLTEDECNSICELPTRKDQVRCLIRLMKGRSYSVIHRFLQKIKLYWSSTLYNDIITKYNNLVQEAQISRLQGSQHVCLVCRLKRDVDIKYVIDKMWSELKVSDALYEDVGRSTSHAGNQDQLWNRLLQECEENNGRKELFQALSRNGYYTHLAIGLRGVVDSGKPISNCLNVNEQVLLEYPSESTCSPASSVHESDGKDLTCVESVSTGLTELDTYQSRVSSSNSVRAHATNGGNRTSTRRESRPRWIYRFIYFCRPTHSEPENDEGENW